MQIIILLKKLEYGTLIKSVIMRLIFMLLIVFFNLLSCQNISNEEKAKSFSYINGMMENSRNPTCFVQNRDDFRALIKEMNTSNSLFTELSKWPRAFKNHINSELYDGSEIFVELAKNTQWIGTKHYPRGPEQKLSFKNAMVTEVVSGNKVKIVQFLFLSNIDAEKAIEKMKLISAYTISTSGFKNPNYYFIKDCAIYFVRTRYYQASTTFKDFFEKKHGKVKMLRW